MSNHLMQLALVPHGRDSVSMAMIRHVLSSLKIPKSIIFLGPNHSEQGQKFSIYSQGSLLPINPELASVIMDKCPWIRHDELSYMEEPSLDILLPLLHEKSSKIEIVPILFQSTSWDRCHDIALGLVEAIRIFRDPVLVIATGHLSQFEEANLIQKKDKVLIECLKNSDAKAFYEQASKSDQTTCGLIPITILLQMMSAIGNLSSPQLDYKITTPQSREKNWVASYASMNIHSTGL